MRYAITPAGIRSIPGLFALSARRHSDIVFARYDHAYDEDQKFHLELAGVPSPDVLALIDANEAQIEKAGVRLHSYTAPGSTHLVVEDELLFTETVGGVSLVDWITRLVDREPVDDVHCTDCAAG